MSARNTLAQPLALYTDHKSHNAQRYKQMDVTVMPMPNMLCISTICQK